MSSDILLRFLLAAGIIAAGIFLYWSFNRRLLARVHLSMMAGAPRGKPVLVYFTAPTCAPCKTVQRPAINQIVQTLGEKLHVLEIDAAERPEVAKTWGVMSVPTIFLLDERGVARYVNHGVTRAEKLMEQIQSLQA
jgi:thioredoxin 1